MIFLPPLASVFHGQRCALEALGRAVQINDMDALMLHEDIRSHLRVPFFTEVAKVATCVKHILIYGLLHCQKRILKCENGLNRTV